MIKKTASHQVKIFVLDTFDPKERAFAFTAGNVGAALAKLKEQGVPDTASLAFRDGWSHPYILARWNDYSSG